MGREGLLRFSKMNELIKAQTYYTHLLWSNNTFLTLEGGEKKGSRGKAAKKLYETSILTWWIAMA